ncbi:DUF5125 domain-containing protein [Sphingobacterium corticibacterium]|uniref:DUF5125 domain-containing protein n=1 Tax=Sphingobacterium corticibacterium TaxID=2484746 RepID=A0A4Q6XGQ4_9SPHI|nr:DUF5125 domain-containing protein [Sphingobacterium corticibacterium]RZF58683.1 DUF5125 domain-containing protein [Sphingobacterium corticibacterium]
MKRKNNLLLMLGIILGFYSCKEETQIDTPSLTSYQIVDVAYMGDSIPVNITVDGQHPLNQIKASFYRNDELIAESIIPINQGGTYQRKLPVPFVKDIENGSAEIQLMVRNKNFNYATTLIPIQVNRPKFPYLTLKTAYGNYRMEPVSGEEYLYAVTDNFPATKLNALIEAPAYGENGNIMLFGGTNISAYATDQDSIPFQIARDPGTPYTVSFDIRSFVGRPFLTPSFGGMEFPAYENNLTTIETELTQGQTIVFDGILDIGDWWIDPTFLDDNGGTYTFRAITGKYRITADQNLKYFKIEPMSGEALADFDPVTKTGGIWVNGGIGDQGGSIPDARLGIPSMTSNPALWNPNHNFAMAPMGDGIYELKLRTGTNLFQSNSSGSTAGFSFYQNSRSLDNVLPMALVQTLYGAGMSLTPDGGSDRFMLHSGNNQSNGNMIVTGSNRNLGVRTFVFTLNTNVSPVAVSISVQ